jgi:hypothetical protein
LQNAVNGAHNLCNLSVTVKNTRIFMFAMLAAFLASCSATGPAGSNMTSPATGGSAFLTPAFIQGQATLAVQAAEIGLQSQPNIFSLSRLPRQSPQAQALCPPPGRCKRYSPQN